MELRHYFAYLLRSIDFPFDTLQYSPGITLPAPSMPIPNLQSEILGLYGRFEFWVRGSVVLCIQK